MVQIEEVVKRLILKDNKLYWKDGPRCNKEAGSKTPEGYRIISITLPDVKVKILTHRVVFYIHNGYVPDLVDHINQNPSDNSKDNLRDASKKLNAINTGMFSNNTSGYKGVSWHANRWTAQIKNNGKKIHLGCFVDIQDAVSARLKAEGVLWNDL